MPDVPPENGGNLSYSLHVIHIDYVTEIMSLVLSVANVKLSNASKDKSTSLNACYYYVFNI